MRHQTNDRDENSDRTGNAARSVIEREQFMDAATDFRMRQIIGSNRDMGDFVPDELDRISVVRCGRSEFLGHRKPSMTP